MTVANILQNVAQRKCGTHCELETFEQLSLGLLTDGAAQGRLHCPLSCSDMLLGETQDENSLSTTVEGNGGSLQCSQGNNFPVSSLRSSLAI